MSKSFTIIMTILLMVIVFNQIAFGLTDDAYHEYYYVSLDSNGVIFNGTFDHPHMDPTIQTSGGEGWNGQWYYYPASDRYIMWFYNGPFDDNSTTDIEFHAFVSVVDSSKPLSWDIRVGWTNANWTNTSSPPMPGDLPTLSDEQHMLYDGTHYTKTNTYMSSNSTYEPGTVVHTRNYRPEWVFVSVRGSNYFVWRWLGRTQSNDTPTTTSGACCNPNTGQCYISTTGSCSAGYTYLGDNTTCASCSGSNYDYGDAPASYPVLWADNGARHAADSGLNLGQTINAESDGTPSSNANLDTSDDGVTFLTQLQASQSASILINTSGSGYINAWIDWNRDGDWQDTGEHVLVDEPVSAGNNNLSIHVPADILAGTSYARFRLSSASGLGIGGTAPDGEVEDYQVILIPASTSTTTTVADPCDQYTAMASQPPFWNDPNTHQINALAVNSWALQGPIAVDDWNYDGQHPVQGIRWWGTFKNWNSPIPPTDLPQAFQISMWSANPTSGVPETMVWEMTTNQWTWAYSGTLQDAQGQQDGQSVFEFTVMLSQNEWFDLGADLSGKYWISIAAQYQNVPTESWAWLARSTVNQKAAQRIDQAFSSNNGQSVWPAEFEDYVLSSSPIEYPVSVPWDMAFELITRKAPGSTNNSITGDLNSDGVVNGEDLTILLQMLSLITPTQ